MKGAAASAPSEPHAGIAIPSPAWTAGITLPGPAIPAADDDDDARTRTTGIAGAARLLERQNPLIARGDMTPGRDPSIASSPYLAPTETEISTRPDEAIPSGGPA